MALSVNVATGLVPGVEFTYVETDLNPSEDASHGSFHVEARATVSDSYARGHQVVQFPLVAPGEHELRVRLLRADRSLLIERTVRITLAGDYALVVHLTRDCVNVQCPRMGDAGTLTQCLSAQCVDPGCVTPGGEDCAALSGCQHDWDCGVVAACAKGACTDGVCEAEPVAAACPSTQYCDPEAGCLDFPIPPGTPRIVVSPVQGLQTTEAGGTASFAVSLGSAPTAAVIVALSSSDQTEGTLASAYVAFVPNNWNVPQLVTVTGVDDADVDGDVPYTIVIAPSESADGNYNGLDGADVFVVNVNDEVPGFVITQDATQAFTTEQGGTGAFGVSLRYAPTADVSVSVSSSNPAEGVVDVSQLTFTSANWSVPQFVTALGVNDGAEDADESYAIVLAPAVSTDVFYNSVDAPDVPMTNIDVQSQRCVTCDAVYVPQGQRYDYSLEHRISADGRYVLFTTDNGHVWLRDRTAGTVSNPALAADGSESGGTTFLPRITKNGRFVTFSSTGIDFTGGDSNGHVDIYVLDRTTGTTRRGSLGAGDVEGNDDALNGLASEDGRYVAFDSRGSNFVAGDVNETTDVFLRDTMLNTTSTVDLSSGGTIPILGGSIVDMSDDGRFVLFTSISQLTTEDTNHLSDLYLRDTLLGTTTCENLTLSGIAAGGDTYGGSLSGDARYVVFTSTSPDIVVGDSGARTTTFRRDRMTGVTIQIDLTNAGELPDDNSYAAWISTDGNRVLFSSDATNLVVGDTNGAADLFVRDVSAGTTTLVSRSRTGAIENLGSTGGAFSADGHAVMFMTAATNIVANDLNGLEDVFVALVP